MPVRAHSSGVERYLDMVEVPGSKPGAPTINKKYNLLIFLYYFGVELFGRRPEQANLS